MSKKEQVEITEDESNILDKLVDISSFTSSAEDLDDEPQNDNKKIKTVKEDSEIVPEMSSPFWPEYVMRQFEENELDGNGCPLVHGLRRVTRLLLGPILQSKAKVIQSPQMVPGSDRVGLLQPAVVEYTVKILMVKLEQGLTEAYPAEYTDAADCYFGNIPDPEFARFLTAVASTRAEARTLRKALQITSVASEEKSSLPNLEASVDGMIVPEQVNFINILCSRSNVNVIKYINMGKSKYKNIEDVPYGVAQKMVEHLSGYQNNPSSIPDSVKGYDKSWREKSN